MRLLRTTSTRRLLAVIAGLLAAIAAGTAIAVAASGPGAVPRREKLATAIHQALAGPSATGIFARITFTNHLIDASNIQGADPLLTGASGRLWLSNNHQLRLELQGANGDAQVVVDNGSFWAYDPMSKTVYKGKLPISKQTGKDKPDTPPTIAQIQTDLAKLMQSAHLAGPMPGDVAGQPAYTVRISPKHDGGLLGAAELAWDAARGVPLRIAVYATHDRTPVLELKATSIQYGPQDPSLFKISPPSGAKVLTVSTPSATGSPTAAGKHDKNGREAEVAGVAAVQRHLGFRLVAPSKLVGVPRRSVSLLGSKASAGALVTYGQYLGGIAVVEQAQQQQQQSGAAPSGGGDQPGLTLPTVSIDGATAQELPTALGTVLRFSRHGVTYTVVGSVPAVAAEAAAKAIAAQTP